jgi:hypothetical protein
MKQFSRISFIGFTLVVILTIVVGCMTMAQTANPDTPRGSTNSALTELQFTEMAENALQGFADGDYAAWSRDWSSTMKGAIQEKDFLAYRQQVVDSVGAYQSIASIEKQQGMDEGYVRWSVVANFEKGQIRFNFGFKEDGTQIEGIFPEAVS